jgi:hypothetical protein
MRHVGRHESDVRGERRVNMGIEVRVVSEVRSGGFTRGKRGDARGVVDVQRGLVEPVARAVHGEECARQGSTRCQTSRQGLTRCPGSCLETWAVCGSPSRQETCARRGSGGWCAWRGCRGFLPTRCARVLW